MASQYPQSGTQSARKPEQSGSQFKDEDKGLVDKGFFAIVRHPSYTIEWFMFFLISARTFSPGTLLWLGAVLPFTHYWLRSERDDHFMGESNPDYPNYRKRVPYKYVYGLV